MAQLVESLCDPEAEPVLAGARFAYLAVEAGRAPHVTPVLFAVAQARLWFVVARSTLKARVIAKRRAVGFLLVSERTALAATGDASLLDPLQPATAARLGEVARAPLAIPSYGIRNAGELAGSTRDAAMRGARAWPADLMLVSVRPRRMAILPRPEGRPATGPSSDEPAWASAHAGMPDALARLAGSRGSAVLGWLTPDGPLAVPVAWEPPDGILADWSELTDAGASPSGQACLCLDVAHGPGPIAKEGLLVRGEARAAGRGATRSVRLRPSRITWWSGFETRTVPAGSY